MPIIEKGEFCFSVAKVERQTSGEDSRKFYNIIVIKNESKFRYVFHSERYLKLFSYLLPLYCIINSEIKNKNRDFQIFCKD